MIIAVDEMIRSALRMRLRERLMEKHGEKPSVISVKITSSLPDDHNSNCLNYLSGIAKLNRLKLGRAIFLRRASYMIPIMNIVVMKITTCFTARMENKKAESSTP